MIDSVDDSDGSPARSGRADTPESIELRALRGRQPELADAVEMHLELLAVQRRVQLRIPLPSFELSAQIIGRHQAEARPLLRFEHIPLESTDLRLVVRQTADILRRFGMLEDADHQRVQTFERDMALLDIAARWYRAAAERHSSAPVGGSARSEDQPAASGPLDQVLTLAMRPFLARCAEVLQQHAELGLWSHAHCPLCGAEPDLSVITPAAERHLICGRCTLRWKFDPLTCPFCYNSDRSTITSFATPDGQYRVYACNACKRYLKAYDGRRATRPVMPVLDSVATLPLDAAAMQRGYSG